jgi:signal transduction histidine kinase
MKAALLHETVSRKAAHDAGDCATLDQLDLDDLRELMQSVTETTDRLQQTHIALQEQVARLQGELAEANDQLRRSRSLAALGEMAAGIAHEIRNPLGSIQLYVQVLADELKSQAECDRSAFSTQNPELVKLCDKIDRAVVGMDAIVRDVLSFARNMRIDPQPTTAQMLLCRALHSCQSLLIDSGIEIVQSDDDFMLKADHGLMTQALSNIVRNAVEAIQQAATNAAADGREHEKRLELAAAKRSVRFPDGSSAERIVLTVEDTGDGIPDEVQQRMFNPFFTTRATGTGLGLAIVHRIVDAHGGLVRVQKLPEGGTRMELCLPEEPIQTSPSPKPDSREPLTEPIVCEVSTKSPSKAQQPDPEKRGTRRTSSALGAVATAGTFHSAVEPVNSHPENLL